MRAQSWAKENWPHYHDPFEPVANGPSLAKIQKYVQGIEQEKRVLLTNDTVHSDPQETVSGFTRLGYVAVYPAEDVSFDPSTGLKFTITSGLSDLQ
ncbi:MULTISPECIES: hypothetical protein [Sinorhizobium]|uniref:Uncharacterized protein n=1 Tax=Sinorhizobium americanum TaxID=194963 RepID=A0A2S3YQ48_9HYPH|nr:MULTISPECIES: hypothetical protein [Sinorhizobium]PDT34004.1 hypothetical protein CO656_27800 [Sinorhizobium sp. FG01]PDT48312.1 hypothetical protein CO664_28990 [Sinorhizobium sp. NG07B]POH29952.1 hypothetical protein ATY30_13620 [Sinorhizobium americanum]POH33204.1 hypothetical protein ATY31_11125 [Sinorhizobium americanum]